MLNILQVIQQQSIAIITEIGLWQAGILNSDFWLLTSGHNPLDSYPNLRSNYIRNVVLISVVSG
jgi:hypothetical protein